MREEENTVWTSDLPNPIVIERIKLFQVRDDVKEAQFSMYHSMNRQSHLEEMVTKLLDLRCLICRNIRTENYIVCFNHPYYRFVLMFTFRD